MTLRTRTALALVGAASLSCAVGAFVVWPATASAELGIAARWPMDESSTASVMVDSGPYGLDGDIGDEVQPGNGHHTFTWPFDVQPAELPPSTERLVVVDHDPVLDPELRDFHIEFRYRTSQSYGNVLQKGQNATPGGYFKIEQPFGYVTCLFKDENGSQKAVQAVTPTNDGQWHTIRCEFDRDVGTYGRLRLLIDGEVDQVNTLTAAVGRVGNDWPFVIGGKYQCNQGAVECDYFKGDVADVTVLRDGLPAPASTTTVASGGPTGGIDAATAGATAQRGESGPVD